jgi:hypothetical protein
MRPDPDRNLEKPLLAQLIFKALTTLQIVVADSRRPTILLGTRRAQTS